MVRSAAPSSTKKARRKRTRKKRLGFSIKRFVIDLVLFCLLLFSLAALGYVVFFRTAVACGVFPALQQFSVFEEPDPPDPLPQKKKAAEEMNDLPRIAVIIDDMGYHEEVGNRLLQLDLELSYAFLPHAPYTLKQVETAYDAGHDILLHFPLQPQDTQWNPGPGALNIGDSRAHQKKVFMENLRAVPHAIGLNNHMGSRYTEDYASMEGLLQLTKDNDLFFVDSVTSVKTVGSVIARKLNVPSVYRQIFLDNIRSEKTICNQLAKLAEIAGLQGWAVGIGHPYPETYSALKNCSPAYRKQARFVGIADIIANH